MEKTSRGIRDYSRPLRRAVRFGRVGHYDGQSRLGQEGTSGHVSSGGTVATAGQLPRGRTGKRQLHHDDARWESLGVLQLMGRAFMPTIDCPFQVAKRELSRLKTQVAAVVVDMHAEATSEKMAMGHFLDGQVTAVVGTHTHVQTADEQILPKGTAYITDIGMTGPLHSVIGIKKELAIEKFLTGMPRRFEVASGPTVFCAVLVDLDAKLGKALSIQRIRVVD